MLEVSKGSKSLRMKINELVTSLGENNLLEVGGYNVINDTVAKLQKAYPEWRLGMPHPESNEPTMTQSEMEKYGILDPKNTKAIDPNADPRYFGPDGQERKAANRRAKDTLGDLPVTFSKSSADYLTPDEWDYKYKRTHNTDGTPKKLTTKSDENPSAFKNKEYKKEIKGKDIPHLDKQIIIFNIEGEFDSFSGIGSRQDISPKQLQKDYKEDPENINATIASYKDQQFHQVFGYVDAYRDGYVKVLDDSDFSPTIYTGTDNDKIKSDTPTKNLVPGIDNAPGTSNLADNYKKSITGFYKKIEKFYAPYKVMSNDKISDVIKSNDLFQRKVSGEGIKGSEEFTKALLNRDTKFAKQNNPNYTPSNPFSKGLSEKLFTDFLNEENWANPEFISNLKMNKELIKKITGIKRFPETLNQVRNINKRLSLLQPNWSTYADQEIKDLKFLSMDLKPKGVSESVIKSALQKLNEAPIKIRIKDLPDLNPKSVKIVNPEFANLDKKVVPRPEQKPGRKGEPATLAKGSGVEWNQFTKQTQDNWKTMYGDDYNNPTKVGLSEDEPGHQPNSNKGARKRFFGVISQDGVLYVQDPRDKKFYPSQNDLIYARAVERLYNREIIKNDGVWQSRNVGQLAKRIWKAGKGLVNNFLTKNQPYDPGKTSRDYFDK